MKKTLLRTLLAIVTMLSAIAVQAQRYREIPEKAKEYIARHFKGCTINHHEKDESILSVEHKVYVTFNGTSYSIEFDRKGNVTEVKSTDEKTALPRSVIPVKVYQHASRRYTTAHIIEWSREGSRQTIELDNGIELKYNRQGNFLRMDD